ncbi:MAG: hypothetical protein V4813_00645 [Gemmatimonadota bacterium]
MLAFAASSTSCGNEKPTGPNVEVPGLRVVAGGGFADTIEANVPTLLSVEVRQPSGALAVGTVVRFLAGTVPVGSDRAQTLRLCSSAKLTCDSSELLRLDTTNAQGLARVRVQLGAVAGRAQLQVTAPDFGFVDSVAFDVRAGAPARIVRVAADTGLVIGEQATLRSRITDRSGNVRPELPRLSGTATVATIDTLTDAVTGAAFGAQWLQLRYASLTDSIMLRVFPSGRLVAWAGPTQKISLVDMNGRNRRVLADSVTSLLGVYPQFDPSRQKVVFQRSNGSNYSVPNIVTVLDTTAGGGRREILAATGFRLVLATRVLVDGAVLVVGQRTGDPDVYPGEGFGVWRVAVDGAIVPVASLPRLSTTIGAADFSHDGTRVAFCAGLSYNGTLSVMTLGTGATVVVSPTASAAPRWSPLDDRIAFIASEDAAAVETTGALVVVFADGTGRVRLTSESFTSAVAWSPSGDYLVASSRRDPVGLRMIRVRDAVAIPLRFGDGSFNQVDWR